MRPSSTGAQNRLHHSCCDRRSRLQRKEAETRCVFGSRGVRQAHAQRTSAEGFPRAGESFSADLNLLVQFAMGIALLAGAFLARTKRYAARGVCQAVVPTLDLSLVLSRIGTYYICYAASQSR
jgi:hypothetical protein